MRRALVVFLLVNILIIAFLIHSCFTLLTLLIEDGAKDAIQPAEIPAPNSPLIDTRPQLIPKIIHQTYINESIPAKWREAQQSCVDMHEDYEYKVSRIPHPTTDSTQSRVKKLVQADKPPNSCGPTSARETSSQRNTLGFSTVSIATITPFNVLTQSAISSLPTSAASTSTSTT